LKKLWERIGDKFSTDASCAAMLEGGGILTTPQGDRIADAAAAAAAEVFRLFRDRQIDCSGLCLLMMSVRSHYRSRSTKRKSCLNDCFMKFPQSLLKATKWRMRSQKPHK
jgi:hypothetical protein